MSDDTSAPPCQHPEWKCNNWRRVPGSPARVMATCTCGESYVTIMPPDWDGALHINCGRGVVTVYL